MLVLAVSPYHLTTREATAPVAMLLADHAVTLLPTPSIAGAGVEPRAAREAVGRAIVESPRYLQLMESWSWAEPLFDEGVVGSTFAGEDAAADVLAASRRIESDDDLRPLRPLMRPGVFDDQRAYLSQVASDVLKAGPDPAISVPVAAGLDAFAERHGLFVARAFGTSIAQRHEARLATRRFAVAIPALLQASADRLLLARALLEPQLVALRDAILECREHPAAGDAAVRDAASAYTLAFDREREDLLAPPGPDEGDEVRLIAGTVHVAGVELPADAVLRSSVAAARRMHQGRGLDPGAPAGSPTQHSLVIKVVGRGPR